MPKARRDFTPFAEGPPRPKQVISLGAFRTGSHSLAEALRILGYRDVYHSHALSPEHHKWRGLGAAADDNIACLPTYTGRTWTRGDFDAYFGPCEALTDVTPLAEPLLDAYPEALVILVHRDFESWSRSFLNTLILPSHGTFMAYLSSRWFEAWIGLHISQTAYKLFMGMLGVSDMGKTKDEAVMKAGYERHYRSVRRMVPKDRLLELDLEDLGWAPICKFLNKEIPKNKPFPRLNESKVFRNEYKRLHRMSLLGGVSIILGGALGTVAVAVGAMWLAQRYWI